MTRWLLSVVGLTAIYAIVVVSTDPWDVAFGAVVSVALLASFNRFLSASGSIALTKLPLRVVGFVPFAARVFVDVLEGTWAIALITLKLRPLRQPGFVDVPIGERSELGVTVTSLATTLSPGEVLVDVDWERRVMIFHSIDASDPDALRAKLDTIYHRYQRRVFP